MGVTKILKHTRSLKPITKKMFPTPEQKMMDTRRKILETELDTKRSEVEYRKKLLKAERNI